MHNIVGSLPLANNALHSPTNIYTIIYKYGSLQAGKIAAVYGKERESDLFFPSAPRKALSLTRRQERLFTFDSSAKRGCVFVSGRIKAFSSTVGPRNAAFSTPCQKSLCIFQRKALCL